MAEHESGTIHGPAGPDLTTFSNGMRLGGLQWLIVGLGVALIVAGAPALWRQEEKFNWVPDYRIPHDLSSDYWLYERWVEQAADRYDGVLLGDSVVWGEYVIGSETLAHYLNETAGRERFANLGLDGAHPLALSGLVEHYAGGLRGKDVLLQCNLLWLSSPRADLRDAKATDFNHPRLVPQFVPEIPSYKEAISPRIGIVVEQHVPFNGWTNHLQQAYYDRVDLPGWTLEHPYDNPLKPLARGLPTADQTRRHDPDRPWYQSGIAKQDYPWVDLAGSLQWRAFQGVVKILQERGNRIFVLVGPFNEHLLSPASMSRYQEVKKVITNWLEFEQVDHLAPAPLPSELYGDASHPLAKGYALLARGLGSIPFFRSGKSGKLK